MRYIIEVGKGKGAYRLRYSTDHGGQASVLYQGINIANGYKKRVKENGKTIARELS